MTITLTDTEGNAITITEQELNQQLIASNLGGNVRIIAGACRTMALKFKSLRDAQKEYFRTRDQQKLATCISIEKDADRLIQNFLSLTEKIQ